MPEPGRKPSLPPGHGPRRWLRLIAAVLGAGVVCAHAGTAPAPVALAVFDFELEDDSPSAALLDKSTTRATTMAQVSSAARQELAQSGHYRVIDGSKSDAPAVAQKNLRNCEGCEAALALQLGADQALIGVVKKVTQTDYYVVVRIRDARTGKIIDQQEANFAGSEEGWASGVRMLIRHQVLVVPDR